jgi:2-phosphosulfolactate phosphatase
LSTRAPETRIVRGDAPNAKAAEVHVVIDVLRAFTVASLLFERGVNLVVMAKTPRLAKQLRRTLIPNAVLIGENQGRSLPGFDFQNSPTEVAECDLTNRQPVMVTTNGVRSALASAGIATTLVAALRNADATAGHLRRTLEQGGKSRVCLVASHARSDDDYVCAELIASRLEGTPGPSVDEIRRRVLTSESADKFIDPSRGEWPESDLSLALEQRNDAPAIAVSVDDSLSRKFAGDVAVLEPVSGYNELAKR